MLRNRIKGILSEEDQPAERRILDVTKVEYDIYHQVAKISVKSGRDVYIEGVKSIISYNPSFAYLNPTDDVITSGFVKMSYNSALYEFNEGDLIYKSLTGVLSVEEKSIKKKK